MNKLPDHDSPEIRAEDGLKRRTGRPRDAELAADAGLMDELAALSGERLPEPVRKRVLRMVRMRRRAPWMAAAAAVLGVALIVPLALRTPAPPEPSRAETLELKQALEILGRTGRDAARFAGSQLSPHLASPEWGLERVPLKIFPQYPITDRNEDHEKS